MKKNIALIVSISVIAVMILGIGTAFFATKFGDFINNFKDETTTSVQTESTTQVAPVEGRPKSATPDSIVACEYSEYTETSAEDMAAFKKFGFNAVIFELTADNGEKVSALLEAAKANSLYFGVKADVSQSSGYLAEFTKTNNTDFIIISGADESFSDYTAKTTALCKSIKENDAAMIIGIEPTLSTRAHESVTSLISSAAADFVYLCHESNKNEIFANAQAIWNEESSPLWLCHDISGVSSYSTDDATKIIELIAASADMSMCKALSFKPFADFSTANGTSADIVLAYILERNTYLLDKEFELTSHKKTSITVEQSKITFRGSSSPAHELKCNGKVITVAKNGDFSTDVELKAGENTVVFEHKGKTYSYKVTYKIKLLKSVSPSEAISVPGGMLVDVSAVAHKNATLTVSFNGKTYKMTESAGDDSDENKPDESSDFRTFTATLETPASKSEVQNLGQYKVTAKYNSLTESKLGANIKIAAKQVVAPPPTTAPPAAPTTTTTTKPITQTPPDAPSQNEGTTSGTESDSTTEEIKTNPPEGTLQKYYYTENYGLGTAQICEIIDDYVETYPGNTTKTFSVPDCSPLLKGTVDYVTSKITCDNETYYVLNSGVKVPELREEKLANGKDGKITHLKIKDGYIMPQNNINVVSSSASNGQTVIVLEMNRPVAFNVKLTGQSYLPYLDRLVAVSSLNCSGLEITFSDTVSAQGSISLMNSVCKSANWSTDSKNSTVTLSLTLDQKGKFYGYHYEYNESGNLVITIKHKPSDTLKGYTIMLDPGHGGLDAGAICTVSSASFGLEKNINLSIATKVKELLEAEGANVLMTRTTDKWVCYTDRNDAVRNKNPDMFISIHCDASGSSSSAMGTSAYYYRAYSQPLAKAIHEKLVAAYKNEIYKDKDKSIIDKVSRGANYYAFRVARVEECPAILIEYGFVTNTEECQVLQTAANREILAAATVEGIKEYISKS